MTKIAYDGDVGIDDALALLFLSAQPDVDLLAFGSVHGNTTAAQAAVNAARVLALVGRPDVPVAVGARRPLAQPLDLSAEVHGADGLGGRADAALAGVPEPAAAGPVGVSGVSAAEQLVAVVRAHPGEVQVVATGPLTNLALALLLEPELPQLVAGVTVMGGTLEHPGNITPFAEANVAHDPEAADLVLGAGWPLRLVGLDLTMRAWLDAAHLGRLEADRTPRGRFAWEVLGHYLGFYARQHGRTGCPCHDPTAALLALDPAAARWRRAPVAVELRSEATRGMLLVDRRAFAPPPPDGRPPVDIAVGGDAGAIVDRLVDGVLGLPR